MSDLRVLGDDSLEGRAPGSQGGERAARYLTRRLKELGLTPAGASGSFAQPVPLHGSLPTQGSRLTLETAAGAENLILWRDYLPYTSGEQTRIPREAPLVFVGYGITAPEYGYDDYRWIDVEGAVAVMLEGEPETEEAAFFDGPARTAHSLAENKRRLALARGACGSILLPPEPELPDSVWGRRILEFGFEHRTLATTVSEHLSLVLHPSVGERLFRRSGHSWYEVCAWHRNGHMESFLLPGGLAYEGKCVERDFTSPNLAAILPGSDPNLAGTCVLVSAHYDHLGRGPVVEGDGIYNGVIDNASGVAGVLEMARCLAQAPVPPGRSILFLLLTGEETGLLGARYYCDHPLVPLCRTVADVNVDGLSFLDTTDDFVALGGSSTDLGARLASTASELSLRLSPPPSLFATRDELLRSDQYAFAQAGIPSLLVMEGLGFRHLPADEGRRRFLEWGDRIYHSPSDDLSQPISPEAPARHVELLTRFVLDLSRSEQAPEWTPGDPQAAAGKLARDEDCARAALGESAGTRRIRVKGSDTMAPLVRRWAAEYERTHPEAHIEVSGGGSATGIGALIRGEADLCTSSRPLEPEEIRRLREARQSLGVRVLCARDALSIYLNPGNPVRDLSEDQLRGILSGRITNWKAVGGEDARIRVVGRNRRSGTFGFLEEHVLRGEPYVAARKELGNTEAVVGAVASDRRAVGYGGAAYGKEVVHCRINGIAPEPDRVRDGSYPLSRYLVFYLVQPPEGNVRDFIDWVLGPRGQEIVREVGYIPLWESDARRRAD